MIKRRTALGLFAGAAAGVSALPTMALAAGKISASAFDPADQDQLALAFRKLAYSMDDKLTFWWMKGTRYGVTGSVATPFWDMYVGAWFTTKDLADGNYEVKMSGSNFYTPPGKTMLLEKFDNPFTGKTVDVPYNKPRTATTLMNKRGGSAFAGGDAPGTKTTRNTDFGPAWVEGGTLHVQGDIMMHVEPTDPAKRTFTVNDWSTYIGSVADVLNPRMKNPPSAQMFNDILDFPPWLQMGDYKGTYVSRCYGRKVYEYSAMPAVWRACFEQKFPEIAKDPYAVLRA